MELEDAVRGRRTIRFFKQQPLPDEAIRALIDAGRLAPCAANLQRIRYIAVRNPKTLERMFPFTAWAALVKPARTPVWGKTAPVAFLVLTGTDNEDKIINADAGAAIQNIQLKAFAMGIGSCWLGSFNKKEVAGVLGIAEKSLLFLIALGYPEENPVMEDISISASSRYYLDAANVLHVPKYRVDDLVQWS